jgi:transposase
MKHVARRHPRQELHVVLDNSWTHGTAEVKEWLFHYTPTSASWLNQVEGFFGILGKQSLAVAHFPSKVALREHIEHRALERRPDSLHLDETRRFDHPLAEANA